MLGRVGSAAIALGLIAALSAALAQERVEPALEDQPVPEARNETRAEQSGAAASQKSGDADQIAPALKAIEGTIRDLITQENAQEREWQKHREIADLQAQQDMALWAKAMFWATVAGVSVTFVGVCLILWTLYYTKRAAVAAEKAVREARKGTIAATRAADAAIESNQLQHRAWLKVVRVEIDSALSWVKKEHRLGEIKISATVENIGNTPATEVFIYISLRQPIDYIDQNSVLRNNSTAITNDAVTFPQRMRATHGKASNVVLFPKDILRKRWICSIPDSDIIIDPDGKHRDVSDADWYKNVIMAPIVIICVDYRLSFLAKYYQTVEIYRLHPLKPGVWMTPAEGDIPANELVLERSAFGGGTYIH